ncbi:Mitochondrial intermembrane space cysteine motif-containing protein MIX17 [Nakaseomyces glabratus]|nr:Mitochondrial intermembrane space cysteine motif-containing protein MIX17 [Nakaseomyces glabratus]KTB19792.1 Mitochondrial intermembrane space cysteine motif-containing protein MIX17 [Nakaseomyces glabratus]
MARSRGGSRPAGRSSAFSRPQQSRSASTAAYPAAPPRQQPVAPANAHPQAGAQPQQPGLFAQMASTAAGVAVGSTIGHTLGAGITGMFSGSGSSEVSNQQQQPMQNFDAAAQQQQQQFRTCDADAKNFTRCLDENNGNFQICDYYLQQLKACQEAARQY